MFVGRVRSLGARVRRRSRLRERDPFPVVAMLLLAVVAGLVAVMNNRLVRAPAETVQETRSQAAQEAGERRGAEGRIPRFTNDVATEPYVSSIASYGYLYPPKWDLREDGAVSKIVNQEGNVLVSFGPGPDGQLEPAMESFAALLDESYADFKKTGEERRTIGKNQALVFEGTALNEAGLPLRWTALLVEGDEDNYAIAAFSAANVDPSQIDPTLEEVFRSFTARARP